MYWSSPGDDGERRSSPSSQSTTRRGESVSPRNCASRAEASAASVPSEDSAASLATSRTAIRPAGSRSIGAAELCRSGLPRGNPPRSRPSRARRRVRFRSPRPHDRPARKTARLAGGRNAPPASRRRVIRSVSLARLRLREHRHEPRPGRRGRWSRRPARSRRPTRRRRRIGRGGALRHPALEVIASRTTETRLSTTPRMASSEAAKRGAPVSSAP